MSSTVFTFAELEDRTRGGFAMGPFGSNLKRELFQDSGIPVLRGQNLKSVHVSDENLAFVSLDVANSLARSIAHRGDIVITHRGTLGQVSRVPENARFSRYLVSQSQLKLSVIESIVDSRYLTYWLRSQYGQAELLSFASQTGVPAIAQPLTNIRKIRISLPSLQDQRAIAGVLGALDDKIESNRQAAQKSESLAFALFEESATAEAILSDIARVVMGASPPGSSYNDTENGLPFYQGVREFSFRFPRQRVFTSMPKRLAEPGDILLSVRAPVGRLNVAEDRCCIGRGLAAIRSETPSTCYYALRNMDTEWDMYDAQGTVFGSLNKAALNSLALPWPEPSTKEELESRLNALDLYISQKEQEGRKLAELRDTLLPELMSGRMRVDEAGRLVAGVLGEEPMEDAQSH